MRLLELVGSLALFVYIVALIWMTSVNVSKALFATETEGDFWARQTTIFLWPLMIVSEEGRKALVAIWEPKGEDV